MVVARGQRSLGTADGVYSIGCGLSVGKRPVGRGGFGGWTGVGGRSGVVLGIALEPCPGTVVGRVLPDWGHVFSGRWRRQAL